MINKYDVLKWNKYQIESFKSIKEECVQGWTLSSPSFNKEFILYNFSYDLSYATVLNEKNDQNIEIPISFMST